MSEKLIKYEGNIFSRFFCRIKNIFSKKEHQSVLNENVQRMVKVENTSEPLEENIKLKKATIEEVIYKFETMGRENLSEEEVDQLVEYYEKKNMELDREILYKQSVLNSLNKKLNKYYETAINLKESQQV